MGQRSQQHHHLVLSHHLVVENPNLHAAAGTAVAGAATNGHPAHPEPKLPTKSCTYRYDPYKPKVLDASLPSSDDDATATETTTTPTALFGGQAAAAPARTRGGRLSSYYRNDCPEESEESSALIIERQVFVLPEGTLYASVLGSPQPHNNFTTVGFQPYPEDEFLFSAAAYNRVLSLPKEKMARLFLGQLPYAVTDMQLQWLCYTFGRGAVVVHPERITKKDPTSQPGNQKKPIQTGCIHTYCHPDDAQALMEGLHKRLLIDDTGVWFARDEKELELLTAHTSRMKHDKRCRPFNRPYDTVVAQVATSTYVARPPMYYASKKQKSTVTTGPSASLSASPPPPATLVPSPPRRSEEPDQSAE